MSETYCARNVQSTAQANDLIALPMYFVGDEI